MQPSLAVLSIGDEVLWGSTLDTNSGLLTRTLGEIHGITPIRVVVVPDNREHIVAEIKRLTSLASILVTSGGLGPTSDDVTREAVATACGVGLMRDERSLEKIRAMFHQRGREMNPINERQAYFPSTAQILTNAVGTADGFITPYPATRSEAGGSWIVSLPGVPRELEYLLIHEVIPWIGGQFQERSRREQRVLKIFGVSESRIGALVEPLELESQGISVSYRASFPEVLVILSSFTASPTALQQQAERIGKSIGPEFVVAEQAQTLNSDLSIVNVIADLLHRQGLKLGVAESSTGGKIADLIVTTPGASSFFLGGVVPYSNSLKSALLGVEKQALSQHGAVSEEVVLQMAKGVRERLRADIGVATTGVAGPDGGSEEKPVGTLWLGLADEAGAVAVKWHLPYERNMYRSYAAMLALDLVRRRLQGFPLDWKLQ